MKGEHIAGKSGQLYSAADWPSAQFEVARIFDLYVATNTYTFNQLSQLVLQGERTSPISWN